MLFGEAVLVDCCDVGLGAVADVLIETVFWILGGEVYHVTVAGDFGDNGGGRDFLELGIGFDTGSDIGFQWGIGEEVGFAVDDNLGKRRVKLLDVLHGAMGGELEGFRNTDLVEFFA